MLPGTAVVAAPARRSPWSRSGARPAAAPTGAGAGAAPPP